MRARDAVCFDERDGDLPVVRALWVDTEDFFGDAVARADPDFAEDDFFAEVEPGFDFAAVEDEDDFAYVLDDECVEVWLDVANDKPLGVNDRPKRTAKIDLGTCSFSLPRVGGSVQRGIERRRDGTTERVNGRDAA